MCSTKSHLVRLGFHQALIKRSPRSSTSFSPYGFSSTLKFSGSEIRARGCNFRCSLVQISAMDEDFVGISSFDDWDDGAEISGGDSNVLSSSDDEESDTEFVVIPSTDVDLPCSIDDFDRSAVALGATTHRLRIFQKRRRKFRIQPGVVINMGLIAFLAVLLLFVDWCSWRIVRLPLPPFYLTRPFSVSAVLVSCAGYLYVPLADSLKIHQILRKEGPTMHSSKKGTPTMGGLFFVPIGIYVARVVAGSGSTGIYGTAAATLSFAAIGLLDDILSLTKNHNYGLPAWIKFLLQVAVGAGFSFWLGSANITSPYCMKMLIPLPAPFGLVYLGKLYLVFTAFCFVSMGNGVNLTDGLDGLAGGTAALAFIGMSIAILPICSDLAIFGASMAGACVGFLVHNGYKASIFMGDTGSLALGGALAAMAACTGMFFPLFISSGIFVLETLSVIMQVLFFKGTKRLCGGGRRFFRMAPLHHHLELCGLKEPLIVAGAYFISSVLAIFAGYVGLISA
ncbi:translocase 11 [Tasmannia lanceolata]|uniref:translocase 11 n=1 Tax=Tasmannia lanceolata TaxID=3420 RepID=UPI00406321D8